MLHKCWIIFLVFCTATVVCVAQPSKQWPSFEQADRVAQLYHGASLENVFELSLRLTESLPTEVEKFCALYRWVCFNITFDQALYVTHKQKIKAFRKDKERLQAWDREVTKQSFQRLRYEKLALCTTYAYLLKVMCAYAGLDCEMIDGYKYMDKKHDFLERPTHTWNAVMIEGVWYLCDPTWSSGGFDVQRNVFVHQYNDVYFLPSPDVFYRNHKPQDMRWRLF
jgi:transglutaminase/protease-like cytokinesis protein 3